MDLNLISGKGVRFDWPKKGSDLILDFKRSSLTPLQQGFSLIEIMVVVFLIALTVSVISVNFNQNIAKVIEGEAKRFVALTELLCQESVIQGRVFAIDSADGNSYQFLSLSNEARSKIKWVPVKGDDLFRSRTLPENMSIEIEVYKAGKRNSSQLIECGTDGLLPRFVVYFEADEVRYKVVNDLTDGLQMRGQI